MGATSLRSLALTLTLAAGCNGLGSTSDGPCEYEATALVASDETPWGGLVGEELLALRGPYPGTWTWAIDTEEIELQNAEQVIAAEAIFEVDPSSYRLVEHVRGGAGVACYGPTIEADGILTFRGQDGETLTSVSVTAHRREGGSPFYQIFELLQPVSSFSSELTELSGVDGTAIRILAVWGPESESFQATFEYVGQELDDSGGVGFIVMVADFE